MQSNSQGSAHAQITGEHKIVDTNSVRPNGWNYNVQSPKVFNKLVKTMRENGFIQAIVVRETAKGLEIINGEHRWRAAVELGMPQIPIVNLGVVTDTRAKQLAIILNELGGQPDQVRLADLLRDISEDVKFDDLASTMPFSDNELKMLIESVDFSFSTLSGEDTRDPSEIAKDIEPDVDLGDERNPQRPPQTPHMMLDFATKEARDALKSLLEDVGRENEATGDTLLRIMTSKRKSA